MTSNKTIAIALIFGTKQIITESLCVSWLEKQFIVTYNPFIIILAVEYDRNNTWGMCSENRGVDLRVCTNMHVRNENILLVYKI